MSDRFLSAAYSRRPAPSSGGFLSYAKTTMVSPLQCSVACPTAPLAIGADVEIAASERMSALAMRFSCVDGREARISPSQIFFLRHDLKVYRVHTGPVSAEMIYRQSGRDRAISKGVREAVCSPKLTHAVGTPVHGDIPVPYGFMRKDPTAVYSGKTREVVLKSRLSVLGWHRVEYIYPSAQGARGVA